MPAHDDTTATAPAARRPWWGVRVLRFYRDGFRSMTVGRTLWAIIGIKLFIFFVIIKWILFPDFLSTKASTEEGKAQYVREQMTRPAQATQVQEPAQAEEAPAPCPTSTDTNNQQNKTSKQHTQVSHE